MPRISASPYGRSAADELLDWPQKCGIRVLARNERGESSQRCVQSRSGTLEPKCTRDGPTLRMFS